MNLDNIQEMAQTQIIGPDEQNESYEEDYTDDNDESKISLETCRLHVCIVCVYLRETRIFFKSIYTV